MFLRRLPPSLAWLSLRFADQGLVSVGNLAIGVLAARTLGPAGFGSFALLWTVNAFAIAAQWAFIISPMQWTVPRTPGAQRAELHFALLAHSIAVSCIAACIALAIWAWLEPAAFRPDYALAMAASFAAAVVQDFVRRWRLAAGHSGAALTSSVLRYGATAAGLVWTWRHGDGLVAVFGAIGFSAFIACIPLRWQRADWVSPLAAIRHYAKAHAESGRVLGAYVGVQTAITAAPIYVLTAFANSAAPGGYRVCTSMIAPIIVLTDALETFLPLRTANAVDNPAVLNALLRRWLMLILAGSGTYVLILWLFGDWLIGKVFGESFRQFSPLLYPLTIAGLVQNAVYIRNVELRAHGRFNQILYAEITAAASLLLGYLVLPFGPIGFGAAVSAVLSQAAKLIVLSAPARGARVGLQQEESAVNDVNMEWANLVQGGFFAEFTYEAKRRYAKSSRRLTDGLDPGTWIVEVGCGTGRFHKLLRELGYTNLVSVDLTIEHLRTAKELNPDGLFVVASGEKLPFKSGVFGALVTNAPIEHFANPVTGLKEFSRVTDENARLVVTSDCYSWRILQVLRTFKSKMPIDRTLTYWGFKRNFAAAGLKIDAGDAWGITHYVRPLMRRIRSFQDTYARVQADDHWSNVTPSTQFGLILRMFALDENMFLLSKMGRKPASPAVPGKPIALADVLASPCCHADLKSADGKMDCTKCGHTYPVVNGIPILLLD